MTDETTETVTEDTSPAETDSTETTEAPDLAAEVEKWKAHARKNEERAKANAAAAKKLREVERDAMSEQERAVDEARTAAEQEAARKYGSRIVAAEVRAAAAGREIDVDALLDAVDPARFLTEDGDVNQDAISQWVDRIAPAREVETPKEPAWQNFGQAATGAPALTTDPLLATVEAHLAK